MTATGINPIIPGFAPDPSCICVDGTYYLVNSTFSWFPGLPIYTSTDLVSWKHVGNAINRLSQGVSFSHVKTRVTSAKEWGEAMTMTGGLYAPTIRHRDGVFYVVCTNVIHDLEDPGKDKRENFIVTSTDVESDQWSDPVWFDFAGIDTCIFWDDDGRSYIHGTSVKLVEIDLSTGKRLSEEKDLWAGTGGVYPEGPHIFKCDGWYYLLISEGGCFEDHAITGARSRNLWGPYEPYEHNPILTARGTDEYVRNIGHSDLFQDPAGNWWAVALGIRKDPQGRYLMGRETFLTPVIWPESEYPRISQIKITPSLPTGPGLSHTLPTSKPTATTLTAAPGVDYLYLRSPDLSAHHLSPDFKTITLTASAADISSDGPTDQVTFIGKRMRALSGSSSVTLRTTRTTAGLSGGGGEGARLRAGLALYKDECRFARVYYDFGAREVVIEVKNEARGIARMERVGILDLDSDPAAEKTTKKGREEEDVAVAVGLRLESTESRVRFFCGLKNRRQDPAGEVRWEQVGEMDTLELTGLDFTGPVVGLFATGEEREKVVFEDLGVQ